MMQLTCPIGKTDLVGPAQQRFCMVFFLLVSAGFVTFFVCDVSIKWAFSVHFCAFLTDKHDVTSTQSFYVLNLDCISDNMEEIGGSNDVLAQKCMKRYLQIE
jgi:hypothetical protein